MAMGTLLVGLPALGVAEAAPVHVHLALHPTFS